MQLGDTEANATGGRSWSAEYLFSIFASSLLLITANYWADWGRANSRWMKGKKLKKSNAE